MSIASISLKGANFRTKSKKYRMSMKFLSVFIQAKRRNLKKATSILRMRSRDFNILRFKLVLRMRRSRALRNSFQRLQTTLLKLLRSMKALKSRWNRLKKIRKKMKKRTKVSYMTSKKRLKASTIRTKSLKERLKNLINS